MPHNLGNYVEVDEIIIKQTLNMLDNLNEVNCLPWNGVMFFLQVVGVLTLNRLWVILRLMD